MNDILRRNYRRNRTTHNRYVTDSDTYWREELHPRIDNLSPVLLNVLQANVDKKITDNIWGFPVDEQSKTNTALVFKHFLQDYLKLVAGRRTWVYTEVDGYWTEDRIITTYSSALIIALWDIGKQLLIDNMPLVGDDLRYRSGKNYSNDNRETYHDSVNIEETGDDRYTEHGNERNKIVEHTDNAASGTTNSRDTSNATGVSDIFNSPQDQGVLPSKQSDKIMNRSDKFQKPETHGVEELVPNGNPKYTTVTSNQFEGETNTSASGDTSTSNTGHNRADERDYLEGSARNSTDIEAQNNVGAKDKSDTGVERGEVLDMNTVLQGFYDIFKDRLLMEIDNRMLPYYLNMKIARFTDHGIGRKEYL